MYIYIVWLHRVSQLLTLLAWIPTSHAAPAKNKFLYLLPLEHFQTERDGFPRGNITSGTTVMKKRP